MLPDERREYILKILQSDSSVKVTDLAKSIGSSISTIRRDLNLLKKKSLLRRIHGGALSLKTISMDPLFEQEKVKNINEKMAIANEAIKYINDGDIIFIEGGSTCIELVKKLVDKKDLVVVTNSCDNTVLIDQINKSIKIIVTGGIFRPADRCLTGELSDSNLNNLSISKAFIGSVAVDIKQGITNPDLTYSKTQKKIVEMVNEVILLVDYSKFGIMSINRICYLEDVDKIITDDKIDQKIKNSIEAKGIELIIAKSL